MSQKLEGVHVGFLKQIQGQRAMRQRGGAWKCVASDKVLKKAGTQSLGAYIDKREATVSEWVELFPILKVCNN